MAAMDVISTPNCLKVSFQYHPLMAKCVQRIPSARYSADGRCWEVALSDLKYVQIMAQWAYDKHLVSSVHWQQDSAPSLLEALPMPSLAVPHKLLIEPYDYQKEGIAYALEKKRCIMGDEMGLGKTVQAIGTLTASGAYPALVICPASLKVNWQRELKRFGGIDALILDDSNRMVWQNMLRMKRLDGRTLAQVVIVNYESLRKFFVRRLNREGRFTMKSIEFDPRIGLFRSVIIDESHKCKSSQTQQSKFVQGIAAGKEYVLELTGTPVVNNNEDLIQQLNIMDRLQDFGGHVKFAQRYCAGANKSSHLRELNIKLRNTCFFRRQKKDVLTQLPDKTRSYLVTDISNQREYQQAERDVIKYLRDFRDANDEKLIRAIRGAVMVKMGVLKQVSARGKISSAVEIIHNTIDGGEKLIVFCYLKEVVQALSMEFRDAVTVTGDDSTKQKQWAVDKFQTDDACKLIIVNYRSGGTGLTLTAASNVLFVEFPWTFSDCCQAEDRAHRNGQKNAVNCVYLLGKDTIDEYLYNLIQTKKIIANGVTGTDDDVEEKTISKQDMIFDAAMDIFKDKI